MCCRGFLKSNVAHWRRFKHQVSFCCSSSASGVAACWSTEDNVLTQSLSVSLSFSVPLRRSHVSRRRRRRR